MTGEYEVKISSEGNEDREPTIPYGISSLRKDSFSGLRTPLCYFLLMMLESMGLDSEESQVHAVTCLKSWAPPPRRLILSLGEGLLKWARVPTVEHKRKTSHCILSPIGLAH